MAGFTFENVPFVVSGYGHDDTDAAKDYIENVMGEFGGFYEIDMALERGTAENDFIADFECTIDEFEAEDDDVIRDHLIACFENSDITVPNGDFDVFGY